TCEGVIRAKLLSTPTCCDVMINVSVALRPPSIVPKSHLISPETFVHWPCDAAYDCNTAFVGRTFVSNIDDTAEGPPLLTPNVYVTLWPTPTGLGVAAMLTAASAIGSSTRKSKLQPPTNSPLSCAKSSIM